jgi:hypothetical protein
MVADNLNGAELRKLGVPLPTAATPGTGGASTLGAPASGLMIAKNGFKGPTSSC